MPDEALSVIGVVGGMFVGWLGVRTWLEARTASLLQAVEPRTSTFVALREGVVVNLLSPHPWIAWGTALGPLTLAAWREKPASGVAFVVGFYALLVGAKVVLSSRRPGSSAAD